MVRTLLHALKSAGRSGCPQRRAGLDAWQLKVRRGMLPDFCFSYLVVSLPSTMAISSSVSPYSRAAVDQPVGPLDPLSQGREFAHRLLELGFERFSGLPAGRIDGQLLPVLLEHSQKAIVIVLVVALQLCLRREVIDLCPNVALQPRKSRISWLAFVCSSPAPAPLGRPGDRARHPIFPFRR